MIDTLTPAPPATPPVTAPRLPWYVAVFDWLIVAAGLVALSTALFGGMRLRVDTLRVSVQSPWRALAVLAVLLVVRHVVERRRPFGAGAGEAMRHWLRDGGVRASWQAMAAIRMPVIVAAYFAVLIVGYPGGKEPPFRASANEFVNLPARWDTGWYLSIAIDGYTVVPRTGQQQNIAFFPAYPAMMRVAGALIGARAPSQAPGSAGYAEANTRLAERTLVAGWLISLTATFLALWYLWHFARETLGGGGPAGAVLFVSAYPFAFFLGTAYTEGLFLLGTVATVYHFRRAELVKAGAWGLLLGLSRPNGCLLSVPLALMALQSSFFPRTLAQGDPAARPDVGAFAKAIAAAAMPGIGMVLFSAWLWTLTGVPLAWLQAHKEWGRTYRSVATLLGDRVETIAEYGVYQYSRAEPVEALYVVSLVLCLATLWPVVRRLGASYGVLVVLTVVPPLLAGGFLSMGRITSTLFPIFVYLGWRIPARHHAAVAMACIALQAMLAAMFFTWRPVY